MALVTVSLPVLEIPSVELVPVGSSQSSVSVDEADVSVTLALVTVLETKSVVLEPVGSSQSSVSVGETDVWVAEALVWE